MKIFSKSTDLLVGMIICIAAILVVLAGMQNALRVLLTFPLAFILPGYAMVAALYGPRTIGIEIHIVFSIALSVSLIALGGLLLNFTGLGLNTSSWMSYLAIFTLLALGIALIRRQRDEFNPLDVRLNFNWMQVAMFSAAVVLAFIAIRTARVGIAEQPREAFTQFWMLPTGQSEAVQVGIQNEEATATTYHLVVRAGADVLMEWNDVELEPGEQWQEQFFVDGQSNLEASLYQTSDPATVYRTASLAVNLE